MAQISLPGQLVRTRRFTSGVPGQFTVTADGGMVLFLRSRAGDDPAACLWALDTGPGCERLLADPAALPGPAATAAGAGEPTGRGHAVPGSGIGAYAMCPATGLVAFTLARELWTVDAAGGLPGGSRPGPRWPIRARHPGAGASPTCPAVRCG